MTKSITSASLSAGFAGLIVTKGSATPSVSVERPIQMPNKQVSNEKRVALTLKIVDGLYKEMKRFGVENNMSTQSVLEVSLKEYLAKHST